MFPGSDSDIRARMAAPAPLLALDLIRSRLREVPDFPKPGILFRDITPLCADPSAFRSVTDLFAERYRSARVDRILAIESRGFLFGAALADRLGVGLALCRKPGKLPWKKVRVEYALEYGTDALETHEDAIRPGERVIILDDVLATGGTAEAAGRLVLGQGGVVHEYGFVIELVALGGRRRLGATQVHALLAL